MRDLDRMGGIGGVDDVDAVARPARENVRPLPRKHPGSVVVVAAIDSGQRDGPCGVGFIGSVKSKN